MEAVRLDRVSKRYGTVTAVDDVTLSVRKGELLALLGPSGCGKTTTLRMIAGFIHATSGEIFIGGRLVTHVPPHRRDTGMVFQSYALFPHLTVEKNIAFGLKMRGVSPADRLRRVTEVMRLVQIEELGDRFPAQLSGGQQQRVALARALVINPSVLLLDEPLSNLDAKLREETREELKRLQRRLAITTIFVTHDQEEALVLSDRIAIMRDGRIEQIGDPATIYREPGTRFVARFIGTCNFLPAEVAGGCGDDRVTVTLLRSGAQVRARARTPSPGPGTRGDLLIRPEAVSVQEAPEGCGEGIWGRLSEISFRGSYLRCWLQLGEDVLLADIPPASGNNLKEGMGVWVKVDEATAMFLATEGAGGLTA